MPVHSRHTQSRLRKLSSAKLSSAKPSYKLDSLEHVNASALPANVLVLLSKYAVALRRHNGLILKLSSLNIFRHVHSTNKVSEHFEVHFAYQELLTEVRQQVAAGNMYTNAHKRFKDKRVKRPYSSVSKTRQAPAITPRVQHGIQKTTNTTSEHLLGKLGAALRVPAFGE